MAEAVLVIACGALAREIEAIRRIRGWEHLRLQCLDASLHNRPERIPGRLREAIRRNRDAYGRIFVAYADCGTAGGIDAVLAEEGVERLDGAHCYEFFAGSERFARLAAAEPGAFYLTDFLARHFDRFVIEPLGLDRHPQLRDAYFGNYRKLVYLSQTRDGELLAAAENAAAKLKLDFEHVHTGYGDLETALAAQSSQRAIPVRASTRRYPARSEVPPSRHPARSEVSLSCHPARSEAESQDLPGEATKRDSATPLRFARNDNEQAASI